MRISDQNNWRERLKKLEHVSGEDMPDGDELWQKLEQRLFPEVKKKKKSVWIYWAAAAALLLMILIPVALKDRTEVQPGIVNHPANNDQQKIAVAPDTVTTQYANTVKENKTSHRQLPDQIKKPQVSKNIIVQDDQQPIIVNNQIQNNDVPVPDEPLLTVDTPVDSPIQNRINNRTIRSYTLAKPPLRTVNIKEMDPVLGQDSNPDNDLRRALLRRTETIASGRSQELIITNQN